MPILMGVNRSTDPWILLITLPRFRIQGKILTDLWITDYGFIPFCAPGFLFYGLKS